MGFRTWIKKILRIEQKDPILYLREAVIELDNYNELKKIFGWKDDPCMDRPDIFDFEYLEDVNERRIRDAESLATVIKNSNPKILLEIGTSDGMGTVLMAANASESQIYTVNILPEEIRLGEGGVFTTIALEKDMIGKAYKDRGIQNITQIFANTAVWEPNIGCIDFAFIDGCHDLEFVYNDTFKILKKVKPGSFILWHDFNLDLIHNHRWIKSVCQGVEKLMADGLIKGRIYHIRNSWVGIYRVE